MLFKLKLIWHEVPGVLLRSGLPPGVRVNPGGLLGREGIGLGRSELYLGAGIVSVVGWRKSARGGGSELDDFRTW